MTREQFDELMIEIFAYYTNPGSWYAAQDGLAEEWYERLEAVPYEDARVVFIDWTYNGSPLNQPGAWNEIPALLSKPWRDDRRKREKFEADRRRASEDARPSGMIRDHDSQLALTLRRVQRVAVHSPEMAQHIIDSYIAKRPADNPHALPRYHCHLCLDNGVVVCWTPERLTTTYACICDGGRKHEERKVLRYNPSNNCRVRSNNIQRDLHAWFPLSRSERWKYETGKKQLEAHDDLGYADDDGRIIIGGDF